MTPSDDISKPVAIEMGESKLLSNKQVVDNQDPVGDLIRSYDVIVISKSWCPYCFGMEFLNVSIKKTLGSKIFPFMP